MHHKIINQHTTIIWSANQHIKVKNASIQNPYFLSVKNHLLKDYWE